MKKLKTPQAVERRQLFKTIAASGISMQALKASTLGMGLMYGRAGFANEAAEGISRVVFVFITDGAPPNSYTYKDGILGSTSAPLADVIDNCILFKDCTSNPAGHGKTSMVLGRTQSVNGDGKRVNTLDVELEKTIGANTSFSAIRLGVETDINDNKICRRAGFDIANTDNPVAAFNRLFSNSASGAGVVRAQRIIDQNRNELAAIKAKLGKFELERLEAQETAVAALEQRMLLQAQIPDNCKPENVTWNDKGLSFEGNAVKDGNFTDIADLHCDTIALSFQCDLTRIATLQLGTSQAEHVVPESGYGEDYHTSIHGAGGQAYVNTRKYLTERLAYLIKKLKQTDDQFGVPLIESTLVLQVSDMGNGNAHDGVNCPFTLAGGQHLITGRNNAISGATNNNLLNMVSSALGVEGDVPFYGDGSVASGILA